MRTGIIIFALAFCSAFATNLSGTGAAVAQDQVDPVKVRAPDPIRIKPGRMQIYEIAVETKVPIKVQVSTTTTKRDGCNGYFLYGSFLSINSKSSNRGFVAAFSVMRTAVGCGAGFPPERPELLLESPVLELPPVINTNNQYDKGYVSATIYVPEGMELKNVP